VIDPSLRVELVKAVPQKYLNKGPFVAPPVGDSTNKLRRGLSKQMVLQNTYDWGYNFETLVIILQIRVWAVLFLLQVVAIG